MPAITGAQIAAAYELSKKIETQQLSEYDAHHILVDDLGMNSSSAWSYLRKLNQMLAGEKYTRTMNQAATSYYLRQIHSDFGISSALEAVKSVRKHLEYYPGGGQPGIAALVDEFAQSLDQVSPSEFERFESNVEELMQNPVAAKRALKGAIGGRPKKLQTMVNVFQRSVAVAAAVRLRANGNCERCKRPAPFRKRGTGLPFLEVHHIVRLANGGLDTVANAIAVCPNCHRELHYG